MMTTAQHAGVRRRLVVDGLVQGVGFRPFVHRLATELGLGGFVGNDSSCVFIEVEGPEPALDAFAARLESEAPALAHIEGVTSRAVASADEHGFRIVDSTTDGGTRTLVPPDVAVCGPCMDEVLDHGDRRHRYPFANCTDCGPRFTIIRDLPYDRPLTTMDGFTMCLECRAEYEDPGDRRFHAQPIACPACGPRLAFERDGRVVVGTDAVLAAAQRSLVAGDIVAVKGVGGYHLSCDAASDAAIERLRVRKGRVDKPFAVMVADLATAGELAGLDHDEATLLESPARPIVLLRRRAGAPVSGLVAPGNHLIGIMLPYTPLHHLLFMPVPGEDVAPPWALVFTSGNVSDEPICIGDAEAKGRLGDLADAFVTHDRPIVVPCDDSVARVVDGRAQPVRRSRGYAPLPVTLPVEVAPTLAVGGELKNTFCVASGRHAWMSQHLGDMGSLETLDAFGRSVDGFLTMYAVEPTRCAVDRHPGYLTRRWAAEHAAAIPVVEVQHHHAHVAAVMAEHGLDGSSPVLGFAFDGTGYGTGEDGRAEIWGGEVLVADYAGFERAGHLRPLPLPGGDGAVRNPCRTALAYLTALGVPVGRTLPALMACEDTEAAVVRRQVEAGIGCVPTTSMGRLFDAVASILGVRHRVSYEAQAAMELEALAHHARVGASGHRWSFDVGDDAVIDPAPVLRGLVDDLNGGAEPADLALAFHGALTRAVVEVARLLRHRRGPMPVVLTGGVFQNAILTRTTRDALEREEFDVLTHRLVPPNDGGLSLGQAVVAGYGGR